VTDIDRPSTLASVPRLAGIAIRYEFAMWRSLYRWILRRPVASGPGAEAFTYAGMVTPVLVVFIVLSAIEVPTLHLVLPWQTVRVISLSVGAYGLLWMFGLLASLRVHPHIVSDSGLRVRNGAMIDFTIPWEAVASVRSRGHSLPKGRAIQFEQTDSSLIAHIVIMKQTNIDVVLREPTTLRLPKGDGEPVTEVRLYVDDPNAFVAAARQCLAAALAATDDATSTS
jgi:hypothetical protein